MTGILGASSWCCFWSSSSTRRAGRRPVDRADLRPTQPDHLRGALGRRIRRLCHALRRSWLSPRPLGRGRAHPGDAVPAAPAGNATPPGRDLVPDARQPADRVSAWFSVKLCWQSYEINDVSTRADRHPSVDPAGGMAVGAVVLCIAVVEQLVVSRRRPPHGRTVGRGSRPPGALMGTSTHRSRCSRSAPSSSCSAPASGSA